MLGNHPITPVLLATDLAAAREFYHGQLGLPIETENEHAIVFSCGSGTHPDVTKSTVGTADQRTQAAWQVSDIRAEVAELRARGVKVEDYDTPGAQDRRRHRRHRLRLGRLDHRPSNQRPRHPPDQGIADWRARLAGTPDHRRRAPERAVLEGQDPRQTQANIRAERRIFAWRPSKSRPRSAIGVRWGAGG